jgi:hypothetical protein
MRDESSELPGAKSSRLIRARSLARDLFAGRLRFACLEPRSEPVQRPAVPVDGFSSRAAHTVSPGRSPRHKFLFHIALRRSSHERNRPAGSSRGRIIHDRGGPPPVGNPRLEPRSSRRRSPHRSARAGFRRFGPGRRRGSNRHVSTRGESLRRPPRGVPRSAGNGHGIVRRNAEVPGVRVSHVGRRPHQPIRPPA